MNQQRLRFRKIAKERIGFAVVTILFLLWVFWKPEETIVADPKASDVTLATHLSLDRLKPLDLIIENWQGPISVAFWVKDFVQDRERIEELERLLKPHSHRVSHCYFGSSKYTYPANILRNRALQLVETKLVFLLDADFVPDRGLHGYLLAHMDELFSESTVYVVPAFQFSEDNPSYSGQTDSFHFPADKAELMAAIGRSSVVPMFQGIDDVPSIRSTNIQKWYQTDSVYGINYEEDYEPYIVAPTQFIPPYDERFLYYGFDKIQHIYHLYHRGFSFKVIPGHFIVHYPHHRSNWGKQQDKDAQKVKLLMRTFKNDLRSGKL